MSRRIIQITPCHFPHCVPPRDGLYALCDDGTVWFHCLLMGALVPRVANGEDAPDTQKTYGGWRQVKLGEIPS